MTFIVAIDGAAGTGKGTIAKGISKEFDFSYFDTGIIYRGLALKTISKYGKDFIKKDAISEANIFDINSVNESEIRNPLIDKYSSIIASIPEVRNIVVNIQRNFSKKSKGYKGIVVDGRDIGTVIFPNANLKLFISASLEERAKRRFSDFLDKNEKISYNEVIKQLQKRDQRDMERSVAPLVAAKDAHLIDTTGINIEETLKIVSSLVIKEFNDYCSI
ncbi:MAG: (d)CMP kinase [Pseudomonadota bacterium]|nr:(d)CMP kinase [Pseudomonadota bacterium]MEC8497939.1 (d)CMP kinase [Pseudomonadota bacterium]|tara:strand:- start:441 stop:1094 length:654 start_codon:yes stop_codon:yes gene_type:complete